MTKKALSKLTEIQIDALTTFSNYRKLNAEHNDAIGVTAFGGKIAGYLEALRDAGIITERDRMALFTYFRG